MLGVRINDRVPPSLLIMVTKRAGQIRFNRWLAPIKMTAQFECKRVVKLSVYSQPCYPL